MNNEAYAARDAYNALIAELKIIEARILGCAPGNLEGFALVDENADTENAIDGGHEYGSVWFWKAATHSAASAAGERAEAFGLNLNGWAGRWSFNDVIRACAKPKPLSYQQKRVAPVLNSAIRSLCA